MEPQQVVAQFLQLPTDAQRVVADLVAYLDRRTAPPHRLDIAALAAAGVEATMLPPLTLGDALVVSPENQFTDTDTAQGVAEWNRPDFDFREWRRQLWERPKAQL